MLRAFDTRVLCPMISAVLDARCERGDETNSHHPAASECLIALYSVPTYRTDFRVIGVSDFSKFPEAIRTALAIV